jgi:DNA-binding NarL/FixJ family response regulator
MSENIRVIVIDDHPLFREGVAYTLQAQPDMEVLGQGENLDDALRLARDCAPDVALFDINIPGGGIAAAAAVTAAHPAVKVIMLTASTDEDDLAAAMRAGARGYILKGVAARELIGIVRSVWAGEGYVAPALAAGLLAGLAGGRAVKSEPLADLTEREREVLELVADGLSNKEVGARLHLSEKTVKHYMTIIMEKLGVRNRTEAALLAREGTDRNSHG